MPSKTKNLLLKLELNSSSLLNRLLFLFLSVILIDRAVTVVSTFYFALYYFNISENIITFNIVLLYWFLHYFINF